MPNTAYARETLVQMEGISSGNDWFLVNDGTIEFRQKVLEPLKISEKFSGKVCPLFRSVLTKQIKKSIDEGTSGYNAFVEVN